MNAVPWCYRILFGPKLTYPLSVMMRGLLLYVLAGAVVLLAGSQNGLVFSQECGNETAGSCCRTTGGACPSGYFRDEKCEIPEPTTTPLVNTTEESNTTDNGVTDSSTNSTNSSFTEDTDDASTTTLTPSIACKRCSSNCLNCNATACVKCDVNFELQGGRCEGKEDASDDLPIAAIAGGAAGGTVFIVVIIVVVICCCRRKKGGSGTETMDTRLEDRNRLKDEASDCATEAGSPGVSSTHSPHPTYENTAFVQDDMSTQIEQGQDRVLRYTRDPTFKKEDYVDEPIYENRAIIDSTIINELGEAPAPPGNFQKHKKSPARSPDPIEEQEEEEIYYNEDADKNPDVAYGEDDGMEIYYNERVGQEEEEEEELYVNYKP